MSLWLNPKWRPAKYDYRNNNILTIYKGRTKMCTVTVNKAENGYTVTATKNTTSNPATTCSTMYVSTYYPTYVTKTYVFKTAKEMGDWFETFYEETKKDKE